MVRLVVGDSREKDSQICGVDLVADCLEEGCKALCEPVEVGCRGFAGHSRNWDLGPLEI